MPYVSIVPCNCKGCLACKSMTSSIRPIKIIKTLSLYGIPFLQCDSTTSPQNIQRLQDAAESRIQFSKGGVIDKRIYALLRSIEKLHEDALDRLKNRKRKSEEDNLPAAKIARKSEQVAQERSNTRKRKSDEDSLPPAKKIHALSV